MKKRFSCRCNTHICELVGDTGLTLCCSRCLQLAASDAFSVCSCFQRSLPASPLLVSAALALAGTAVRYLHKLWGVLQASTCAYTRACGSFRFKGIRQPARTFLLYGPPGTGKVNKLQGAAQLSGNTICIAAQVDSQDWW